MPIPSSARNLRTKSMFAFIDDGLEIAYVEAVDFPKPEWGIAEHGGAGSYWNTIQRARLKIGEATITKVVKAEGVDDWLWNDLLGNIGSAPSAYQKDRTLVELGHDGSYVRQWIFRNSIIKAGEMDGFDGNSDEFVKEKATIRMEMLDFENLV